MDWTRALGHSGERTKRQSMNLVGNITATHNYRKGGIRSPAEWLGHEHKLRASPLCDHTAFTEFMDATNAAGGLWLYRTVDEVSKEAKRTS